MKIINLKKKNFLRWKKRKAKTSDSKVAEFHRERKLIAKLLAILKIKFFNKILCINPNCWNFKSKLRKKIPKMGYN